MERRGSKRITVNLKAERISCTRNCSVFIENLSEHGIHMTTAPTGNSNYVPGSGLDIRLKLATGETIKLNCNVKWSYEISSEDRASSVGLEIVDPPEKYLEFIKTLH